MCCITFLLPTKFEEKLTKACISYSNCSKWSEKKIKKNTKKLRQILKTHVSLMVWPIQLKFETGGAPSQESFHSKNI